MNELDSKRIKSGRNYAGSLISNEETLLAWGRFFEHKIKESLKENKVGKLDFGYKPLHLGIKINSGSTHGGWIFVTNQKIILYSQIENKFPQPFDGQEDVEIITIGIHSENASEFITLKSWSDRSRWFLKQTLLLDLSKKLPKRTSTRIAISLDDELTFHTIMQVYR